MIEIFKLIKINIKIFKNKLKLYKKTVGKQHALRTIFLSLITFLFLIGIHIIFYRVLNHFNSVPIFGPVLITRLLSMVFLTFLSMLIFSNIIVSISTLYLSDDINLLMSIPTKTISVFNVKFFETLISSSWMVVLIWLPIWAAYARVTSQLAQVWDILLQIPLAIIIIIPFLVISACIGVFFTMVLMRFFPAQKTREIFILLSVGFACIITILFRLIPPNKLTNPGELIEVMQYLASLKAPVAPYLPSYWATEALLGALYKRWNNLILYTAILVVSSSIIYYLILIFAKKVFYQGWCNAGVSFSIGKKKGFFDRINFSKILSFLNPKEKALIIKDIKIFRRDTAQWPQLLLLISIVVIYLFNVHHMSIQKLPSTSYAFFLRSLIFFLNIGFAGFIISAVAARFVFPAVSIEGKSFWIIKSSPISIKKFLWGKFWTSLLPMFFLAELLIILSTYFMRIDPFMTYLSIFTVALFSIGLTSLGVGMGAVYPKFDVDNPSEIATSWGGLMYMIWSIAYIGLVLIIEAGPVRLYYLGRITKGFLNLPYIGLCVLLLLTLNILMFCLPMKFAINSLVKKEI